MIRRVLLGSAQFEGDEPAERVLLVVGELPAGFEAAARRQVALISVHGHELTWILLLGGPEPELLEILGVSQ